MRPRMRRLKVWMLTSDLYTTLDSSLEGQLAMAPDLTNVAFFTLAALGWLWALAVVFWRNKTCTIRRDGGRGGSKSRA